jgi:pyruvate, orthophosphate dikinase
MARQNPWVYSFYPEKNLVLPRLDGEITHILGGKAAHLFEMCRLGLPVPPGFTLTTELCAAYYAGCKNLPKNFPAQMQNALRQLEKQTGKTFGDVKKPLLVSVRSGARISMPGMMDTVLNLGLNDQTVFGLIKTTHDERFAFDCYRRFIQMYGQVVLGIDGHAFEQILDHAKLSANAARDTDLTAAQLRQLVADYKSLVRQKTGRDFPQDPMQQLQAAIMAVFNSWQNVRAKTYRKIHHIPESWGTAVTVQAMVFGNMGDDCGTGVAFTRNPSSGEKQLYGEYLWNAQGEDVVAGIRTPQPIMKDANHISSRAMGDHPLAKQLSDMGTRGQSLQEHMPKIFAQLQQICILLERHYRDMQDIEFTIEAGKLYLLQTRSGKRTAAAAMRIAHHLVKEKLLTIPQALLRLDAVAIDQLLHPRLDPDAEKTVLARGLPASPGAASGVVCFTADEAEDWTHKGQKVILVRSETSPEDIHGMHAAVGIITTRGGMTSHAAVVARGMGRPCIVGASAVKIDYAQNIFTTGGKTLRAGDWLTIEGSSGEIIQGQVPMVLPQMNDDFAQIMRWADTARQLRVRVNADTPADAKIARDFGAEGVGLCRTEHMFFDPSRIALMRQMILATTKTERQKALAQLLPHQRGDFAGLFREMRGLPVTIRLLDPPLHEFLPHGDKEIQAVAENSGIPAQILRDRVQQLAEANPMLGLRGCRLAVVYPEIYAMQVRAIIEAAIAIKQESGKSPEVEIMLPLIMDETEFSQLRDLCHATAQNVLAEQRIKIDYSIGSMIELPRAALRAGQLAGAGCEFFSFGTNDLTQTTLGLSRDDAGSFLPDYQKAQIFPIDPFVSLDQTGVGELVQIAVARGRAQNADLKIGICGEHGGDPVSIDFFARMGLDYVSCSPYRVPIARLAAAQAAIRLQAQKKPAAAKKPVKRAKAAKKRAVKSLRARVKKPKIAKKSKRRAA